VRDPLNGWTRKDGALADLFSIHYLPVAGLRLVLRFGEVRQAGVAAQVAGDLMTVSRPSLRFICYAP
jgi:hypothetical protein